MSLSLTNGISTATIAQIELQLSSPDISDLIEGTLPAQQNHTFLFDEQAGQDFDFVMNPKTQFSPREENQAPLSSPDIQDLIANTLPGQGQQRRTFLFTEKIKNDFDMLLNQLPFFQNPVQKIERIATNEEKTDIDQYLSFSDLRPAARVKSKYFSLRLPSNEKHTDIDQYLAEAQNERPKRRQKSIFNVDKKSPLSKSISIGKENGSMNKKRNSI